MMAVMDAVRVLEEVANLEERLKGALLEQKLVACLAMLVAELQRLMEVKVEGEILVDRETAAVVRGPWEDCLAGAFLVAFHPKDGECRMEDGLVFVVVVVVVDDRTLFENLWQNKQTVANFQQFLLTELNMASLL